MNWPRLTGDVRVGSDVAVRKAPSVRRPARGAARGIDPDEVAGRASRSGKAVVGREGAIDEREARAQHRRGGQLGTQELLNESPRFEFHGDCQRRRVFRGTLRASTS